MGKKRKESAVRVEQAGQSAKESYVRNLEARLAETIAERDKFRAIVERADDSIFIKDEARRYTFINHAMLRQLGLAEEYILGKTPEEVFGRDQSEIVKQVDDRTFSGETVDETRVLNIDGVKTFFHTVQTPLTTENGKVTSIMGVVRDVTEQKQEQRRDFHDTVGQHLTGLRFLLSALRKELSSTDPKAAECIAQIEQVASDALASAWQMSERRHYLSNESDALVKALRKLAREVSGLYGIQCRFTSRKVVLIETPETASHLFLIAREAVTNALKHAKASRIAISLSERSGKVILAVRDDGVGFASKKSSGLGLGTMGSRAELIGASLDTGARKTGGTVVTCSWKKDT